MKYDKINRRFFLQGLGGSLLALPIIPSLLTKAEAQSIPPSKYLVMLGSGHGGVGNIGDWAPMPVLNKDNPLLSQMTMFSGGGVTNPDHIIRHARLNTLLTSNPGHIGGNVDGSQARLSYILGSFLNPHLAKMNFFNGIDIGTFYSGHHRGVFGGNLSQPVNNPDAAASLEQWPTLDQFLGASSKFYPDPAQISLKTITNSGTMSHAADGTRLPATAGRIDQYYNAIFSKYENSSNPTEIAKRAKKNFLVDRVYEDYKRLVSGSSQAARRISSVDKKRVESHIESLFEVQNKHKNFVGSCGNVTGPNARAYLRNDSRNPAGVGVFEAHDLLTDLIVSAFTCGATKASGLYLPTSPLGWAGDYHQEVVHQASSDPLKQLEHNKNFRANAERIVTSIVSKLDAVSADGQSGSLLDNGLVMWSQECGRITHQHSNIGLVTFGSLGGFFNTGNFVDYTNYDNMGLRRSSDSSSRPGIPIPRFWANVIQGFGFTPAEFERNGKSGYGDSTRLDYNDPNGRHRNGHTSYPTRVMNSLSAKLPIITS
jgi:hypothetical protein